MNKKKWNLILVLSIILIVTIFLIIFNDTEVIHYETSFGERIKGAIIVFVIVITSWIILAYKLLKPEPKVVKVNMADNYKNISSKELSSFGIEYDSFKDLIYNKFKDITLAFASVDYDKLKINLTDDLYNYYVLEIDKLKKKGYKNIVSDMELLNFKVYDISDNYNMLRVCVYLNVMMCDYMIDTKDNKLVDGSIDDKREFEYELIFIKNHDDTDYVMSMKKCINQMSITKNENKDIDY